MKNFIVATVVLFSAFFLCNEKTANAQNDTTFNYTGAIQTWTIPPCAGNITVVAYGAQGGDNGGLGAQIQGTFSYPSGTVLDILVGGKGGSNDASHGSGGGGSFVILASNDTILVIAGGGGGHGAFGIDASSNGSASRAGQNPSGGGGGGTNGGGGAAAGAFGGGSGCANGTPTYSTIWASGGGGFCGNGGNYDGGSVLGGQSYLAGGAGGSPAGGANAAGGFGGGGGAGDRGAGGGGYSGGAGGTNNSYGGGGGGSYNAGTNQINNSGVQSGNGMVFISWANGTLLTAGKVLNHVMCHGGNDGTAMSIVSGGAGPYTYSWAPTANTGDTATGLSAGTYTLSVTDVCGDSAMSLVTITQPAAWTTHVNITSEDTGNCTGSAMVTVSGGKSPYTYSWSGGGTTNTISGKCAGTYCCTITDSMGCTDNVCATIVNTGIQNISDAAHIKIYPNPNTGQFTLSGLKHGEVIELYNYMGQKLESRIAGNSNTMQFDISARTNGIYLVKIETQNGELIAEKQVMKQ